MYYIYESNLAVENYKRRVYPSFLYFDAKKKKKKSLIEIKKKKNKLVEVSRSQASFASQSAAPPA